ncbi:MAG TPA: response regulator [Acidobacteriota bacterium]|jgi:CheY-like chemotaxis protein
MANSPEKDENSTKLNPAQASFDCSDLQDHSASLPLAGIKVLVVDDDFSSLQVFSCALEIEGAKVREAASAAKALTAIEQDTPDIVISDLAMPDQDGYDLIRQIRSHPEKEVREVPALAITGFSGPQRRTVLAAGFQDLISKPVDLDFLVLRIARLLSVPGR